MATFSENQTVRLIGAKTSSYSRLQDAYAAAASGDLIEAKQFTFLETLTLNRPVIVTFAGGRAGDFSSTKNNSILKGALTVSNGTAIINNLSIH